MANEYLNEHKELHKKIVGCKCIPLSGNPYCDDCIDAIIKFTNDYGAGSLTQDVRISNLKKKNQCLVNEIKKLNNSNLKLQLQSRIHKLEK